VPVSFILHFHFGVDAKEHAPRIPACHAAASLCPAAKYLRCSRPLNTSCSSREYEDIGNGVGSICAPRGMRVHLSQNFCLTDNGRFYTIIFTL
jgi:hypothetical protein